jgi:hypothetical protein
MNVYNLPKGTICVLRQVGEDTQWLMLAISGNYTSWNGCFSII